MTVRRLLREIKKGVSELGGEVLEAKPDRGHLHFLINHDDGVQQHLVTASTPSVPEHTVNNALKDVKRFRRRHGLS